MKAKTRTISVNNTLKPKNQMPKTGSVTKNEKFDAIYSSLQGAKKLSSKN
ncbi:hypothetical protein SynBIOSE41_02374 [Synechococcus sp. BIOS-E4-1]|nr:hypothetical protein SynBIOSE41_02374 [Synechococcus sp. BIOS-E4-1]